MEENLLPFIVRPLFVGDKKTGKTNIIQQYLSNAFTEEYHNTIGVEYYSTYRQ